MAKKVTSVAPFLAPVTWALVICLKYIHLYSGCALVLNDMLCPCTHAYTRVHVSGKSLVPMLQLLRLPLSHLRSKESQCIYITYCTGSGELMRFMHSNINSEYISFTQDIAKLHVGVHNDICD